MWINILLISILSTALCAVSLIILTMWLQIRDLRETIEIMQADHGAFIEESFQGQAKARTELVIANLKASERIMALEKELEDAYFSLNLALGTEANGLFNDVAVEIGLNGVTYQFHQLDKEEADA